MGKSPGNSKKCDTNDNAGYEFDPPVDFSQFLEEARQHARQANFQAASSHSEDKGRLEEDKKSKKSWRSSLFSWWKSEKKSKPTREPATNNSRNSKARGCHISGPMFGSGRGVDMRHLRRQNSGPLANLLNPTRKAEKEMRYMCLNHLKNPHPVKAYGPVYLVT